ncbi:MAG: hypothetical protein P1P82_16475 [Bacteroidales bacterium]|nr:hypothetical protein [Bacteroidales bacterium]MDT8432951.1 hypothetical protein [Bacteroidales bacterium]
MKYTLLEKLAIVKILDEMILADEIEDPKEKEYLSKVAEELGINTEFIVESRQLRNTECFDILRRMEADKKQRFAEMLGKMVEADGIVDPSEVNIMISVFEYMGLNEKDEQPLSNVPDINYILFKPAGMYAYNKDFKGDRKTLHESSSIKIESAPSDGRNYQVTIFKPAESYQLWGVELIYPTHTMTMTEFNEDVIILESDATKQKVELFYEGIDINRIRFHDDQSGSFLEFVN